MAGFIYRCPSTGLNAQAWTADEPPKDATFERAHHLVKIPGLGRSWSRRQSHCRQYVTSAKAEPPPPGGCARRGQTRNETWQKGNQTGPAVLLTRTSNADVGRASMRPLADSAFALGCCIAVGLAGPAPAMAQQSLAQQSFLYPPEVRVRPVVMVLDPRLERHYWDPRYCDFDRAAPDRWRWQDGARR